MSLIMGTTDFDALYKTNFNYTSQLFIFAGLFIAFSVKTLRISFFFYTWFLKAHVKSALAGIVLKLSLYGILTLMLFFLAKAYFLFIPLGIIGGLFLHNTLQFIILLSTVKIY